MEPRQLLNEFRGLDADKRKEVALLILPEAGDALPEANTAAITERILGTLPREQQVDLVAELAQSLTPDQQAQATVRIADGLPSGKKAETVVEIAEPLPRKEKRKISKAVGGAVPKPVLKPVWLIVVVSFAILLLGSAAAVFVLVWTGKEPLLLLPFVTAAIGVLAGLLVPVPSGEEAEE